MLIAVYSGSAGLRRATYIANRRLAQEVLSREYHFGGLLRNGSRCFVSCLHCRAKIECVRENEREVRTLGPSHSAKGTTEEICLTEGLTERERK